MSKLTDRISYLQGLAEGMKLNPDKDSHKLILGILDVLGEVGESFEALAESHGELSDYVESIDEDLADLEADLYDDEDEDAAEDTDGEFESTIEYECPHCGTVINIDPDDVDFDDDSLCPNCGKELFPELPEGAEEEPEEIDGDPADADDED
jgi:rubrerythrin